MCYPYIHTHTHTHRKKIGKNYKTRTDMKKEKVDRKSFVRKIVIELKKLKFWDNLYKWVPLKEKLVNCKTVLMFFPLDLHSFASSFPSCLTSWSPSQ